MDPYPLTFEPLLKERVWGGRRLAELLGKPLPPGARIGESWELADLPESVEAGRSVIASGPLAGLTLRDAIDAHREMILGPARLSDEGGFPLLIKYLDACENLSVQVHPDADYVRRHPDAHLKSEAWVIVDAEPGSVIYKGLKPGVSADQFRRAIETGSVADLLCAVPAEPGACHYLPSGTVHALGAGIVVAEIQTPSDTTFRLYDWGRDGRDLHIDQALACIRFDEPAGEPEPSGARSGRATPPPVEASGIRTTPLAATSYFSIERVEPAGSTVIPIVTSGMPEVWMILAGTGAIQAPGMPMVTLRPGLTILMPAALPDVDARASSDFSALRVTLPSPLEGMLA